MSKNTIHNFNILIKNSAAIVSSEHLTEAVIKELAEVSKEMNEQKDIVQLWQEYKAQNNAAFVNNYSTSIEGGATDNTASNESMSAGNTPSDLEGNLNDSTAFSAGSIFSAPNGGGVTDTNGRIAMDFSSSAGITPSFLGGTSMSDQTYANVAAQQMLTVPQRLQINPNEPSPELIKAEMKKKLDQAIDAKDTASIDYWTSLIEAFKEGGAVAADYDGKPNHLLFTEMYAALKISKAIENQNFNWESVRTKMINAIDANILNGVISDENKKRWTTIKNQLADDKTNVANLFEQYDELFLLLKEVEGLETLPNTITITAKTKIYPNLSADKLYASIGREDVYVFLKEINTKDITGRPVEKGAVKIKNTTASSFIVGESLEFFVEDSAKQHAALKENINWIVYKDKDKGIDFINEGTSFSYNFDAPGVYKIEAYGISPGAKKKAKTAAFVEVKIIAQQIVIKAPAAVKNGFTRPAATEKVFNVTLKNPAVKTLNPLKFYYQIENIKENKVSTISAEKELDSTGVIKLTMPDLGTYKIKVASKGQYVLKQESVIEVIKNEVTSIGLVEAGDNVFVMGNPKKTFTLEAKSFKINPPTDEEKEDVKWIIYDAANNLYLPPDTEIINENRDPQKPFLHKWGFFTIPVPQKEGNYIVEAYSHRKKGANAAAAFKLEVKRPQVSEAYWAYSDGSKKKTSGFAGEVNYIKANIPRYSNQSVRINFYLNNSKDPNYYNDTKTNENGEINKIIKFDAALQKRFGIEDGKTAKISFKLMGIQDGRLYPFKKNTIVNTDAILDVTSSEKISDVYFQYEGKRVTAQDQIALSYSGAFITIVAKTQNMIGKEIVLTAHKVGEDPIYANKTKINSEGKAVTTFKITRRKDTKIGEKMSYYVGIEGYSTKHIAYKGLNMIVSANNENKYGIDVSYFLAKYNGSAKVEANLKVLLNDMNEYYTAEKITPQKEQVAYMLATAYTETFKTFKPVLESYWVDKKTREEYCYKYDPVLADTDKRRKTAIERGNTTQGDGVKYCGRGYVQLTWKNNYIKVKDKFGVDVVNYPDKALEPKLAAKIMIWGMDNGIFTGASINRFINDSNIDYISARKVINGTDRKNEIANDAKMFEKDLKIFENRQALVPKSLTAALKEMKIIADKHLPYEQEGNTGKSDGLRTSLNDNALSKMDCSEFVCRYLQKLGITKDVKWVTTASMLSESSFQKALGTDKIKFVGNSKEFKPQAGDIFVWSRKPSDGHTGIVYKYDSAKDLVTIIEAIGKSGSADQNTNIQNGGYSEHTCTRTSVYKTKGKALFGHEGFIGYFRPQLS
jgi:predicted chitinase